MTRFLGAITLLLGILVLAAEPACSSQRVLPIGIDEASEIVYGLYPADDAGSCCWLTQNAQIRIEVPAGADTLLLNIYVPDFAVRNGSQSMSIQVGGAAPVVRCCVGIGEHELVVPLPSIARRGVIPIRFSAKHTFVPKLLGMNQDQRHLSVMLRDVGFLNSATGERLSMEPLPWMSDRAALPFLLCCGIGALLLTLRRPSYGVIALLATDPFLFAYSIHSTTVTLPKVMLIAVAAGMVPRLSRMQLTHNSTAFYILASAQALFLVSMLPGGFGALFHGAAMREILKAAEYLATFVIVYLAYRADPSERVIRVTLVLLTIVVAAVAFAQPLFRIGETEMIAGFDLPRIAGPLEGPNQFAGFLGVVIPVMFAFALLRERFWLERFAIGFGTIACFMTFSRGGLASLIIAMAIALAVRYLPLRQKRLITASGILLFVVILGLAFGVFSSVLHGKVQLLFGLSGATAFNGGLGSRVDLWHGAYALWRSHPLFGIGPGNFELEIGRFVPGARTHANSEFFQVLVEQGLAGLGAVLVVTIAPVMSYVKRLRYPLAFGACMASIAMGFHQIVDCMWLYPKVGVMWWLVLGIAAAECYPLKVFTCSTPAPRNAASNAEVSPSQV